MTRILKIIAVIGAILVAFGVFLSVIGFALGGTRYLVQGQNGFNLLGWGWRDSKSTDQSGTELTPFRSIQVRGGYLELILEPAGDGKFSAEKVFSGGLEEPDCQVKGDTLEIESKWPKAEKNRGTRTYRVTVYYPSGTSFDELSVDLNAGEVTLGDLRSEKTDISVSAAAIDITNADLGEFSLHNAAGDVHIADSAARDADISLNMGNLEAEAFDTDGLRLDVDMGNVEMSGAFRGNTNVSVNMGNADLSPTLPSNQYSVKNGRKGTLGAGDAPNIIDVKVNMGGSHVDFDD